MSDRPIDQTVDVDGEGPGTPDVSATAPLDAPPAAGPWLLSAIHSAMDLPVVDRAHYQVIAEHARGGLGRILKARDQRTRRIVAIKELLRVPSDDVARRFAREALITANLQHPSIIPVYELGRWESGEPFYAMKFVLGRSFEAVIVGCKTLDERLARLPIVVSVADALAYSHARRVIHRDLKPANVLVGDLGETVVIDWGLAKSIGDTDGAPEPIMVPESVAPAHTVAGAVMGTPSYMPPEQARGEPTDERSDVYQIGALLYHLIAGVHPYYGRKVRPRDLVKIVAAEPPPSLVEREPGTPLDLATIVGKAMARTPSERYANAGELSEDLRRFTTGQLVRSHHYDRATLLTRWLRRNRASVTVGSVLAVVLIGFAIWSITRIIVERNSERAARTIAQTEKKHAEESLSSALYEKGRTAEAGEEWARAAMYYAAAGQYHDTPTNRWAAGLAEARAVIPQARHAGHKAWVRAAAISPDGERVATVDEAGELRVWAPSDGHLLAARSVSQHALFAVGFSPDGRELAVAGDDGKVTRMSIELEPVAVLEGHVGRIWSLAYSPDGKQIASAGEDKTIRLWPTGVGEPRTLIGHTQRIYSVAFSPDGKRLASGSDDRHVWIWNLASGHGASRGDHKAGGIRAVAFTPTGDTILTTGWDHTIRAWKGDVGPSEAWDDADVVESAVVSPAGDVFVTVGQSAAIHAWEISTHRLITKLEAAGPASTVAFSRDGRWLVTAGESAPIAWDATAFRRLVAVGHRSELAGLAFTRDGNQFVSGARDHTVRLWDVATATELRRVSTGESDCSDGVIVLDDGDLAATCDNATVRRWDRAGLERNIATKGWLRITALSQDGATLAAGHEAGRVALVDVASWKIRFEKTLHAHNIYDVKYMLDGRLVTAGLDDHVRVWHGADLTQDLDVLAQTDNGVLAAALAPDGKLLALGTQEGSVHVWDVGAARWLIRDLGAKKLGVVWKLVFTPDGSRVLTASDNGVRIWSSATWGAPDVLDAGEGPALALAVSPDGTKAVAGYRSGAIVIWDLRTRAIKTRIGGRARYRGTCSDVASQAWNDAAHRAIVTTACATDAALNFKRLAQRTHQRLGDADVTWDWLH